MDEKLKLDFDEWLNQQPNTWMLSQSIKNLLFKAFLFGIAYKKGDR